MPRQNRPEPRRQRRHRAGRGEPRRPERRRVQVDERRQGGGPALVAVDLRAGMEGGDDLGKVRDMVRSEATLARQGVEQVRLREPPHLDHGVDEAPGPVEGQAPVRSARDPPGAEVERGCRAAVEHDLGLAGGEAPLGGREVEIGEADGALELEHAAAGQEEPGDVGGYGLHLSRARQGLRQERGDGVLVPGRHADRSSLTLGVARAAGGAVCRADFWADFWEAGRSRSRHSQDPAETRRATPRPT